jgi:hypothetical protein
MERAVPPSAAVAAFIAQEAPDVVLVTPLVGFGSRQADYVVGARAAGVPVVFCTHSWDNLTNKGLVRGSPDLVAVWNEAQRREAVELHGIPTEGVVVTGAHSYDHWFGWEPSRTRAEFAEVVGLRPDRPILLYTCSSPFIAPDEVTFFRRWLRAVRENGDQGVAGAGVLVRPHPQNAGQWKDQQFADDQVAIWPRAGANPMDDGDRADYYDSLHHAAAVLGINTSSLVEAAIVGRPVHTVLADEFRHSQTGTLHFHLLNDPDTGFLETAATLEEHLAGLARVLASGEHLQPNRRFLEAFVRPAGLDVPAAPRLADAIEALATSHGLEPSEPSRSARLAKPLLWPLARLARREQKRVRAERQAGKAVSAGNTLASLVEELEAIASPATRSRPVLAGPFLAEVGYELLYWLPFLAWALDRDPGLRNRMVAVSRGGAEAWYRHLGIAYADVYDVLSPEELRALQDRVEESNRGSRKQSALTEPERELLERIGSGLEGGAPLPLHPSLMFDASWSMLKSGRLLRPQAACFRYERFEAPDSSGLAGVLPEDYVAARFYFNAGFPDTPENREFVRQTLRSLAEQGPVVLLDPAMRFDDHSDAESMDLPGVIRLEEFMTPRNNLEIQTIAISRARAFVGTYGGLSYLPIFLGRPAIAFYSGGAGFRPHHLELAQRIAREDGFGRFTALDVTEVPLLRRALTGALEGSMASLAHGEPA